MPDIDPQVQPLLDEVTDLAVQAHMIGSPDGDRLGEALAALIEQFTNAGTTPPATGNTLGSTPGNASVTADPIYIANPGPNRGGDVEDQAAGPQGEYDPLAALGADIDEIGAEALAAAHPSQMTLFIKREDGLPVDEDTARTAVRLVLPSITAVVGQLQIGPVTTDVETPEGDAIASVTLDLADGNTGAGLAGLGAGRDGFNAAVPLPGGGTVLVTSQIGEPADRELAEQIGVLPVELPEVEEGQHAINGALTLIEQETGWRPEAERTFTVTYTKDNGDPLSDDEVAQILAHPLTSGPYGLSRFGRYQYLETVPGQDPSRKVARFVLLDDGEINLATVAVQAAAYRGTFDFGGTIGSVSANADVQLVGAQVEV